MEQICDSEPRLTLKTSEFMHGLGRTRQDTQSLGILRQNPFCLLLLPIFRLLLCSFAFLLENRPREKREYISVMLGMVVKLLTGKGFGVFFQLVLLMS